MDNDGISEKRLRAGATLRQAPAGLLARSRRIGVNSLQGAKARETRQADSDRVPDQFARQWADGYELG